MLTFYYYSYYPLNYLFSQFNLVASRVTLTITSLWSNWDYLPNNCRLDKSVFT